MEENRNRIEEAKKKLYDPNYNLNKSQNRHVLHELKKEEVKTNWDDNQMINRQTLKPKTSFSKKFFIFSLIFFFGAFGFALFNFLNKDQSISGNKIDISFIGSSFVKGGETLPLQIEITNKNNVGLVGASLMIEYPKGAEDGSDVVRLDKDQIGTIGPGETVIRNIKVKLYGAEKSIRNIKASLEYRSEGSNAILTKEKFYPVTISLAPISLTLESPEKISSDQEFSFKVSAKLNTEISDKNTFLQISYPSNFNVTTVSRDPLSNFKWNLSEMNVFDPFEVEVKGRLVGQDGEEPVFHAYVGTAKDPDSALDVVYSSALQRISIVKPFLDATILVNGSYDKEVAISDGGDIGVKILWANNLSEPISDAQITATLSGNIFDKMEVNPGFGYYDSVNSQIVWNKSSYQEFATIAPGKTGNVSFDFRAKKLEDLGELAKNPQAYIKVSIRGRQSLGNSSFEEVNNFTEKVVKVLSKFQMATSAEYYSGNKNLKAESETKFMINWSLSNSTNQIIQAKATAVLPLYVKWIGALNTNKEIVSYNDVTREITWNIGTVSPNTGMDIDREVSFVASITPSVSFGGKFPVVLEKIFLTGIDSFTNREVTSSKGSISTSSISGVLDGGIVAK